MIPGSGRSAGEGIGYPLQRSWASLVAQLEENLPAMWETWVRSLGWEDPLEKERTIHSRTIAWKIPWTEEPGGLQSLGSLRVGYDWATSLSLFIFMHWRRKWQPTPVFLPGESQGPGSLVGCRLWGCTESDTTERLSHDHLCGPFLINCIMLYFDLLNLRYINSSKVSGLHFK